MGSPRGRDLNDWYATPEQQVFLCFSALTSRFLKETYGEVSELKHWKHMKHFFPYLEKYIPDEHKANLPHRLKDRGDKLNRYEREHPTHVSRKLTSGRYWNWAKGIFDDPTRREFSIPEEEFIAAVEKYNGGGLQTEQSTFLTEVKSAPPAKVEEEFIDINEMYDILEELVDRVDELSSRVDRIMKHLTRG